MKIWADLSAVVKLAATCLLIGFVLGLSAAAWAMADEPGDESRTSASAMPEASEPGDESRATASAMPEASRTAVVGA